jgi:hypothetical protein
LVMIFQIFWPLQFQRFGYLQIFFSYNAGAHKTIKGHHVFFIHDPEHVGTSFEYMLQSGVSPDMYVMICGRVTTYHRNIIKRSLYNNFEE